MWGLMGLEIGTFGGLSKKSEDFIDSNGICKICGILMVFCQIEFDFMGFEIWSFGIKLRFGISMGFHRFQL